VLLNSHCIENLASLSGFPAQKEKLEGRTKKEN